MRPSSTGPLPGTLQEGSPGSTLVDIARPRGGSCMAKLSKVDAAKAAGVSRQTLYTYIKDSRLSVDADGLIDTAELLRAGFTLRTLHEIRRQDIEPIGQQLTSRLDALDVYQDMIT